MKHLHLAFCVITKGDDELDKLKNLMASVEGVFDSVHITANHNHTETKKYCEDEGYQFTYLGWADDFATQRNYNFSQVPAKTDFIIWADTDDVIINPHLLRDIARIADKSEYDTVFFAYWYGAKFDGEPSVDTFVEQEITHYRERLIRPNRIIWKKRIHETPIPVDGENFKYSRVEYSDEYPIAWLHLGADRDMSPELLNKRMARNRRLLEMELKDERVRGEVDPRTLLYLMKIYAEEEADEQILRECIEMGKEYISKSGWDEERAVCYQLMAKCMGFLGEDAKARDFLLDAIKEYPYAALLYLHLARTYYNLGDFRAMKHWMDIGMGMDIKETSTSMSNILEMKVLSAELMLEYNLYGEKNIRRAYEASKLLAHVNPTESNKNNESYLFNQVELDRASEGAHKLMQYYADIQREDLIPEVVKAMPKEMQRLPFANKYFNKYRAPRVWKEKEICYYANFGGEHFEKWDGRNLAKGIGGSETAVIRLAEEWTQRGYSVVVYGDPIDDVVINGVVYLPYYKFNPKDKFNIFIQWRASNLAGKISAKKFYVDLHDVYDESSHINKLDHIDKLMVKSNFHREYAPNIPTEKMEVISNGI